MDPSRKKVVRKVRTESVQSGKDALVEAISLSPSTAPFPLDEAWVAWVEAYRQRLEEWLLDEKFYAKSWNKLAAAICKASPSEEQSVSGQALQDWVRGKGLPLKSDRIKLLAAYRKTTPEHMKAWLEDGKEIPPAGRDPAGVSPEFMQFLRSADLSELLQASDLITAEIRLCLQGEGLMEDLPSDRPIPEMLRALMAERQMAGPEFARFAKIKPELLELALSGEELSESEVEQLSKGLSKISAEAFSPSFLQILNRSGLAGDDTIHD